MGKTVTTFWKGNLILLPLGDQRVGKRIILNIILADIDGLVKCLKIRLKMGFMVAEMNIQVP